MSQVNTRYYKHYKNKPYRLIGTVRHSETLEEMAFYECLYENKLGTLWVRPKEMFFENVVIEGKSQPRFKKIDFKLEGLGQLNEEQLKQISNIYEICFKKPFSLKKYQERSGRFTTRKYFLAYEEGQLVGFKLGYAIEDDVFYSWQGGVLPAYRKLGVASELMNMQHDWCKEQGFKRIETRTRNQFSDMISLNLKFGFIISGTQYGEDYGLKLCMEKVL